MPAILKTAITALLTLFAILIPLTTASANVTYVSINGNNANNCSLNAPCRTISRALTRTPAGGEIRVLDSGSFGASATIDRSVTISGALPGTALAKITINVNSQSADVVFRNLHFIGGGTTSIGINAYVTVKTLLIENCLFDGFTSRAARATNATVRNSVFQNNYLGLYLSGDSQVVNSEFAFNTYADVQLLSVRGAIRNSSFLTMASGIRLFGPSDITISGSSFVVQSGATGILKASPSPDKLTIVSSTFQATGSSAIAINAYISDMTLSASSFSDFYVAIQTDATVYSRQNNTMTRNGANVAGSGGVVNLLGF